MINYMIALLLSLHQWCSADSVKSEPFLSSALVKQFWSLWWYTVSLSHVADCMIRIFSVGLYFICVSCNNSLRALSSINQRVSSVSVNVHDAHQEFIIFVVIQLQILISVVSHCHNAVIAEKDSILSQDKQWLHKVIQQRKWSLKK